MISIIIRTLIIYLAVVVGMRLMGKRQLGEMQPGELVVTILMSEVAAIPIEDAAVPLIYGLIPIIVLVSLEIINSLLEMKSVRFRMITEGNPQTVIKNGELDQKQLKSLRLTVNDILAALRQKDIFDIEDVQYAVVETNGTLSVLLKPEKRNSTPKNYDKPEKDNGIPCPVIIDGKTIQENFLDTGITVKEIKKKIEQESLKENDIVLMTVDKNKKYYIIKRTD